MICCISPIKFRTFIAYDACNTTSQGTDFQIACENAKKIQSSLRLQYLSSAYVNLPSTNLLKLIPKPKIYYARDHSAQQEFRKIQV